VSFPGHKPQRQDIGDYVRYAHEGPIRSSIPEQTERAKQAAERAEMEVAKFRKRSVVAAIGLIVAIVALTYQALDFVNSATDDQTELRREVRELRDTVSRQGKSLRQVEAIQP